MEKLQEEYDVQVEWKAFELMPEGRPRPTTEQLREGFAGFARTAAQEGIKVNFNPHFTSSRLALEGAKYAQKEGKFEIYNQLVYQAQFINSLDIADLDVLTNIAEEAGLDAKDFKSALRERRMNQDVEADIAAAKELEVRVVPTFFIGGNRIVGSRTETALVEAVEQALSTQ